MKSHDSDSATAALHLTQIASLPSSLFPDWRRPHHNEWRWLLLHCVLLPCCLCCCCLPGQIEAIEGLNNLMSRVEEAMANSRKSYEAAIAARNNTGQGGAGLHCSACYRLIDWLWARLAR